MTSKITKAVRFFARAAGYSTPPGRMACAKALALAEQSAEDNGWEAEWQHDEAGCSGCDCGSKDCPCSSGVDHETLACVLKDERGKVLASLSGICGATADYRRVVEAELAQEAMGDIESAQEEKHWEASCALAI